MSRTSGVPEQYARNNTKKYFFFRRRVNHFKGPRGSSMVSDASLASGLEFLCVMLNNLLS